MFYGDGDFMYDIDIHLYAITTREKPPHRAPGIISADVLYMLYNNMQTASKKNDTPTPWKKHLYNAPGKDPHVTSK